jgi:PAS domain S-box-containing protein
MENPAAASTTQDDIDGNHGNSSSREKEDLLRLFIENVRDYAIFLMDAEGDVMHWPQGAERVFGYTEREVLGQPASIIFTPEDIQREAPLDEIERARTHGRAEDKRWHRRKDESRFWADGVLIALTDHTGHIRGFGKVLRDATSEERLRFAVQSADIGTWHWDFIADNLSWSDQCKAIFGTSPDAAVDYDVFLACLHPDDRDRIDAAVMHAIDSRSAYDVEFRVVWPDGSVHWVNSKGRSYHDNRGKAIRFEGIAQDITERKRTEEKVRRLLSQVQARAKREALLNRIGQAIRGSRDPRQIQGAAAAALVEALGVDRCVFIDFDIAAGIARVEQEQHRSGISSRAGEYRIADFGVDVEHLYRDGRTLVVEDVEEGTFEPNTASALMQTDTRSGISVPLFDNGRLVTALTVAMANEPRLWTSDEVVLVETVATQVRSAVEAARIAQREHAVAVQLQEALMPAIPDTVDGLDVASFFRPALEEASVGGDFLDVFPLEENCTALVIGDVSGKGLAAAAQVATVRNTLRYVLYRSRSISEALSKLNQTLTAHNMLSGFVTMFIGVFDGTNKQLRYVSCGHEPALWLRAENGTVEELLPTGPILGLSETTQYTEGMVQLGAGDKLLIYTDGLTDAGPDRSELLGVAGLIKLMRACHDLDSADRVSSCIIEGAEAYARTGFHDDVCMLTCIVE